jgi:hypothetical protein
LFPPAAVDDDPGSGHVTDGLEFQVWRPPQLVDQCAGGLDPGGRLVAKALQLLFHLVEDGLVELCDLAEHRVVVIGDRLWRREAVSQLVQLPAGDLEGHG